MLPPDKDYKPTGYVNRATSVVAELQQYQKECNIPLYYSAEDCISYLEKVYPTFESAFLNILSSFGVEVRRDVIIGDLTYPYVIPSQKIAIVFAHNLTHCLYADVTSLSSGEGRVGSYYFSNQATVVNANRHGYECIHIFDWDDLCRISMMFMPKQLISCANCEVDVVTESELVLFLDLYHVRGSTDVAFDRGYAHLGLYYEDDLVYVLTVGQPKYKKMYGAEIYRLCSNPEYHVTGGWRLLFNTYCNSFNPESVVAFRDMSKQPSYMYSEMGMNLIGYMDPRRFWGRENDRLTEGPRFLKTLNIQYEDNCRQSTQNLGMMLKHGWIPMCDCGSAVYEWRKTQ